jgi:F-type H+-transporting ATPase subunit b
MRSLTSLYTTAAPARPSGSRPSLLSGFVVIALLTVVFTLCLAGRSQAQPHEQPAQSSATAAHGEAGHGAKAEEHGPTVLQMIAKVFNFAVLVGLLVYYLRSPIAEYLSSRSTQIRQDLVTAADTRAAATAQLAEIQRKLATLPGELEALKAQGAEDVKAEKVRIAAAARVERERLLEQTRREIDMRLRIARRSLIDLAADLAVSVARERIARSITPEDQLRLVDRYTQQLAGRGGPDGGAAAAGGAR